MGWHGCWHGIAIYVIADQGQFVACVRQPHCLDLRVFTIPANIAAQIEILKLLMEAGSFLARA